MPVYDGVKFLWVITERWLLHWVSQQVMQENFINLAKLPVSEVPIFSEKNDFVFVSTEINIYQADEIFTKRRRSGRWLDVMFITQNGRSDEDIVGIVWDKDVALIDDFVV